MNYIPTWAQKMEYYGWYTVFFEIAVREIEIAVTLKGHRIKKIPKVSNVFKKHKRFGFMTLLQCEKKPLYSTSQHHHLTTAWLAQLGERRSAEREVTGSKPCRTNSGSLNN